MKATSWNPAEFASWYEASPLEKRSRVWTKLESKYKQLYIEWTTFGRFASVEMGVERTSATTLDPNSCSPSAPDVACSIQGKMEFFELGEVVEQSLASAASHAERERNSVFGGAVDIWAPLEYVLHQKCSKEYCPAASPLHLVLYYGPGRQPSFAPFLAHRLTENEQWIGKRVAAGPFTKVFLYDDHERLVLATFTAEGVSLRALALGSSITTGMPSALAPW